MIFEHTIIRLLFGYVSLLQTEYYFLFLFSLLFFSFLFLLLLSTFEPLNALYSKFERLKILGRTRARLNLGVTG